MILPFIFSFVLASVVRKLATKLENFTGLGKRSGGVVCLIIVYLSVLLLVFLPVRWLVLNLPDYISRFPIFYGEKIKPMIEHASEVVRRNLNEATYEIFENILIKISESFSQILGKIAGWTAKGFIKIPEMFFMAFVIVLASFFICFDYQQISGFIKKQLPLNVVQGLTKLKTAVYDSALKLLGCNIIMIAITFAQLFLGFLLLGVERPLLISAIIAFLDALPMIGVGSVLIPWAIIAIFNSKQYFGIGLIVLFIITSLVHSILEPKILGKKMGIHPLISLIAVYIGVKTGGILTSICMIFAISILKYLNQNDVVRLYK